MDCKHKPYLCCHLQVISNNNKSINGNELRFFASFPHAHTTGNGIKTNLVRNGKEVANVIEDDNYDFNFQVKLSKTIYTEDNLSQLNSWVAMAFR